MRVARKALTAMGKSDETAPQLFVLVADDEPNLRSTIVEILSSEGYDAIAVVDGRDAVEHARKAPPDIFLTDLAMPGMSGIEAAKQIKVFSPKTRVIFFSGHGSSSEWLAKAKKAGYDFEVIAKPIRPEALIRAL